MRASRYISYADAFEFYDISKAVLHTMKFKKTLPDYVFKKDGKLIYTDINYFLRYKELKIFIKHHAQLAVYFMEEFGTTMSAARVAQLLYGGNVESMYQTACYDLFLETEGSLTNLQIAESHVKYFKLFKKIKYMMRQHGLSVDDAFLENYHSDAKKVYDEILSLLKTTIVAADIEVTLKDFECLEDYFDYFEAKIHLSHYTKTGEINVRKETARA